MDRGTAVLASVHSFPLFCILNTNTRSSSTEKKLNIVEKMPDQMIFYVKDGEQIITTKSDVTE